MDGKGKCTNHAPIARAEEGEMIVNRLIKMTRLINTLLT
jgi:hypothetical protein